MKTTDNLASRILLLKMERFFISRIRRYYELELPRSGNRKMRWPLLIAMHGYQGDKASMLRVARQIADGKMVVISLQGPHQFFTGFDDPKGRRVGFGWGTTWKMEESVALHHSDTRTLIEIAAREYKADRERVFLLAFSQACAYNYRFVFTYPRLIRGTIGVCGGIPGDWDVNPRFRKSATHVLHIAATRDQWYTREQNLDFKRKLTQRAASLDFRFYNSPHKFPRASIPHVRKWMEEHL